MLAVKPKLIPHVLDEIAAHMKEDQIIFSFAAGVTIASIERVSHFLSIFFNPLQRGEPTVSILLPQTFNRCASHTITLMKSFTKRFKWDINEV